jgi:hypothetical protein
MVSLVIRPRRYGASCKAASFLVALALSLGISPALLAQQLGNLRLRVQQTASWSLTLTKPTDPYFESALDENFPGISAEDGYEQAIKPWLAIVENSTGLTAVAYAITWQAHYADGSSQPLQAVYLNRPLMDAGAMTFIPPGGVCLIAPTFNLTPAVYLGFQSSFAHAYPAGSFPASNGLSSVDVNVDGVVYSDGSFIGPDVTRVLQRYVAARFAARDEALAVLNLIDASTAPQSVVVGQLQKVFSHQSQWGLEAMQANHHTLLAFYVRGRGNTAADFRRILLARGLAGLKQDLQNFVDGSGGSTKPSMFDQVYQNLTDSDPRVFGTVPWQAPSSSKQY